MVKVKAEIDRTYTARPVCIYCISDFVDGKFACHLGRGVELSLLSWWGSGIKLPDDIFGTYNPQYRLRVDDTWLLFIHDSVRGIESTVSFRWAGYCWRIQFQPRKLFKFGRIKRISSLFGEFANSITVAESLHCITTSSRPSVSFRQAYLQKAHATGGWRGPGIAARTEAQDQRAIHCLNLVVTVFAYHSVVRFFDNLSLWSCISGIRALTTLLYLDEYNWQIVL